MTASASPIGELTADPLARTRPTSLWRDTLGNILRQRSAIVGLVMLGLLILVVIFADVIATHNPTLSMLDAHEPGAVVRAPPCIHALGCAADKPEHYFGLDANVRDVFSRIVHASRISLQIGILTVGFAIIVGTLIGSVAGFVGGWLDTILMRLMDVLLAFPSLLLAIGIVTVLGPSLLNAQLAIGVVAIPIYSRVMRASVLSVRENDYVVAARAIGVPLGPQLRGQAEQDFFRVERLVPEVVRAGPEGVQAALARRGFGLGDENRCARRNARIVAQRAADGERVRIGEVGSQNQGVGRCLARLVERTLARVRVPDDVPGAGKHALQ